MLWKAWSPHGFSHPALPTFPRLGYVQTSGLRVSGGSPLSLVSSAVDMPLAGLPASLDKQLELNGLSSAGFQARPLGRQAQSSRLAEQQFRSVANSYAGL